MGRVTLIGIGIWLGLHFQTGVLCQDAHSDFACSWINTFVDPGTTFKSNNQIYSLCRLGLQPWLGV